MTCFNRPHKSCWRNLMVGLLTVGLVMGQSAWAAQQMRGPHQSYPNPGNIHRQLPPDHQSVRVGSDQYYFHSGIYYHRDPRGFRVARPPKGLLIDHLPLGFETLIVAGMTYFVLAGIFYQQTASGYVVVDAPPETGESVSTSSLLTVSVNLLNVRSGPGMQHPVINQVAQGTRLAVQGNATGWYYVRLPNGTYGWVMSAYTRLIHPDAKG